MGGGGKNCREEGAIRRQRWGAGGGGPGETGRSRRMRRQIEKHEVGDTAHRRLLFSSPFYPHYTLMNEALLLLIPNTCQEEETLGSNGTTRNFRQPLVNQDVGAGRAGSGPR